MDDTRTHRTEDIDQRGTSLSSGRLLLDWLGADPEAAKIRLTQVRGMLIRYFSAERLPFPQDLADETISRVSSRIDEGIEISCKAETFFYSVAKNVAREEWRRLSRTVDVREASNLRVGVDPNFDSEQDPGDEELYLDCLDRCLSFLSDDARRTIIGYYVGKGPGEQKRNRRRLAESLGTTQKALNSRALRLRRKLEECVGQCVRSKLAEKEPEA